MTALLPEDEVEILERRIDALADEERRRMVAANIKRERWPHNQWLTNISWVNAYKTHQGCLFCEERDHACLDLHHRKGTTKINSVSAMVSSGRPIRAIIFEVRKCDVVCANCHRKTHYRDRYNLPSLIPHEAPRG